MFVPHHANVLVKILAIFGVINRIPATTPAYNVFCYSTVAHIWTSSINLAFRPKSGFKNKCQSRAVFGLAISGSGRVGFKMRPFHNSVWVCMHGPARGDWKDTSSTHKQQKNRLKSCCEVGYANFRPNVFAAGKTISMEIFIGLGLHAWCPVAKDLYLFQKTEMCKKNINRLCNVKQLEQDIKSRCNPHFL